MFTLVLIYLAYAIVVIAAGVIWFTLHERDEARHAFVTLYRDFTEARREIDRLRDELDAWRISHGISTPLTTKGA